MKILSKLKNCHRNISRKISADNPGTRLGHRVTHALIIDLKTKISKTREYDRIKFF